MTPRLPDPARSRAVLIGVGRYADPALADLPAVENNLTDLHAVLTSPHGTGLPSAHCALVRDPDDQAEVGAAVSQAAAEAEDTLLVYYAGHGLLATDAELWLATARSRRTIVAFSSLSCAELRKAVGDSPARRRVLVLDCCFAGRATARSMAGEGFADQVDVRGAYTLAATAPTALALAPPGARTTLFTGALLDLLRNGIPGEAELLTVDSLYRSLRGELRRRGGPEPIKRDDGAGAGDLALARNAADRVAALRAALDAADRELAELTRAESTLTVLLRRVQRMITGPQPPPPAALADPLRARHGELLAAVDAGAWPSAEAGLAGLDAAVGAARAAAEAERARAARLLDARAELRGRLDAFHAMAVRLRIAEDAALAGLHGAASSRLREDPCDLGAAEEAVSAYLGAVVARREAAG
ncbi:caspase, EACC1-associated type [Actinokineospora sp. 24-640]